MSGLLVNRQGVSYSECAAYLVADRRPTSRNAEELALPEHYLQRPDWELVAQVGDLALLRRGPQPALPA